MCEPAPAPLHRSAEVEDLTDLTEEDKKKIEEEAQKGKTLLPSNEPNPGGNDLSLEGLHKDSSNQQDSNRK